MGFVWSLKLCKQHNNYKKLFIIRLLCKNLYVIIYYFIIYNKTVLPTAKTPLRLLIPNYL